MTCYTKKRTRVLTSEECVLRRWKEFFEDLMNLKKMRARKTDRGRLVNQEVKRRK